MKIHECICILLIAVETWQIDPGNVEYYSATSHLKTSVSFIVNKTNKCTEFQFYWYYDSTCFGQSFCPSSGVLSRTSALVHFL